MSFSHTCDQLLGSTKTVTRRLGWKNLQAGQVCRAVRKCQGLKKGEKVDILGYIRIISVRRERLDRISSDDVVAEGFPDKTPAWFINHFAATFRCPNYKMVARIEFVFSTTDPGGCQDSNEGR